MTSTGDANSDLLTDSGAPIAGLGGYAASSTPLPDRPSSKGGQVEPPPTQRRWWQALALLFWEYFLDSSPPWLVSLAVHITAFLILALLFTATPHIRLVDLTASFSTERGEQLDEPILEMESLSVEPTDDQQIVPLELPPVEMPLATAPTVPPSLSGLNSAANFDAPVTAISLSGRDPGMKQALLKAYGGNATTEQAVRMALDWLARRQESRGSWSLKGQLSRPFSLRSG